MSGKTVLLLSIVANMAAFLYGLYVFIFVNANPAGLGLATLCMVYALFSLKQYIRFSR